MSVFSKLKGLLKNKSLQNVEDSPTKLIYITLPAPLQPLDRGDKYEDYFDAELRLQGLGYVSGGGSSLSDEKPDGTREIEWCGIDVDTIDIDQARALLRDHLPVLGCLAGTTLQFTMGNVPLQDEFDGSKWRLDVDRTEMHPGFGV